MNNNNLFPQLGLSYAKENNKWSYAFYPTLYYGIADEQFGTSLNSIIEYSSPINQNWDIFGLAILDLGYGFGESVESQQYVNIGFQHKKKFVFGVNVDFEQEDDFSSNEIGYGIFIGVNF
ncbi:MAG: hypothetical protein IPK35_12300 [Saprospiraceae bacterium]|nr:hypothetical protein [Saprospiraceae bacterium]